MRMWRRALTRGDAVDSVTRVTNVRDLEPPPYVIPLSLDGREVLSFEPRQLSGWAAYYSDETDEAGLMIYMRIGPRHSIEPEPEVTIVDGKPALRIKRPQVRPEDPLEIREVRMVAKAGAEASSGFWRTFPWSRIEAAVNHPRHRAVLDKLVQPSSLVAESLPGELHSFRIRPAPQPVELPDLHLDVPGGYRKPDSFYRRVAELFLTLASISSRPAQELAEANGIKPATVHRWISEAKSRGLLALPSDRTVRTPRTSRAATIGAPELLKQAVLEAGGEVIEEEQE